MAVADTHKNLEEKKNVLQYISKLNKFNPNYLSIKNKNKHFWPNNECNINDNVYKYTAVFITHNNITRNL